MPELIVGPMLRHLGERDATIWMETDAPCEAEVLGHRARTFTVYGHHYALVVLGDLEPGTTYEYAVKLNGEERWPEPDSEFPKSQIRTYPTDGPFDISFGSCRVAVPQEPPFTHTKDENPQGKERDALTALAGEMLRNPEGRWPHLLLLLGDQVYADEGAPETRAFIRSRRDTSRPPHEEVADFEEYTHLYRESWREPVIRWLFANVSTSMVIDDHDVRDDWNISRSWLEEMRATSWWHERIVGALMSYWLYQHLGNLSPRELGEVETYRRLTEAEGDAGDILREYAVHADEDREGVRWSFHRDLGPNRVIVMDSRVGRVLKEGRRSILDDTEWDWVTEQTKGDFDHLMLATSDPFLLAQGMHFGEAFGEQLCNGVWGGRAASLAEKIRRAVDLDHWAAFRPSFDGFARLLRDVGAGRYGEAPASISVLSGDVHHAYLCDVAFPRGAGVRSHVYQAVCSPYRNPLGASERRKVKLLASKPAWALARGLARLAGVPDPEIRWRFLEGPYFDNQVASLNLDGRSALVKLEKTKRDTDDPRLDTSFERRIA